MVGKRKKSKKGRVKLFSKLLLNSKPTSATIARARLPAHSMICHQCDLRTQLRTRVRAGGCACQKHGTAAKFSSFSR